jgi:hypothetical protein
MKLLTILGILAGISLLSGCYSFESRSEGKIGCIPEQIKISNHKVQWGVDSWVATCKNKRFICSKDRYDTKTSCTPEK